MIDYNAAELNDLSVAGSKIANGASSIGNRGNVAQKAVRKKLRAKKLAKKKKKAEKSAKKTKRTVVKTVSSLSSAALAVVFVVVAFVVVIYSMFAAGAAGQSGSTADYGNMSGSPSVQRMIQLAHEQKGNGGSKYWNAMNGGVGDEWCAMYAGWLLREGGGINLEEYGWSAGVGVWCDNLNAKGIFHLRETNYTPVAGDIIIFGSSMSWRTHVGIVIGCENGNVYTSEGNTDGGTWDTTCVGEHEFSLDTARIVGYGHVTYPDGGGSSTSYTSGGGSFSPRMDEPSSSSKYFYSNENPFKKAGYGIKENNGNCTAYAWGRAYEILGSKPRLSTGNAGEWYEYNKKNKCYPYGTTPKLGAILCLKDVGGGSSGHVAVVEKINADSSIVTSESGWNSYVFKTNKRRRVDLYTMGGPYKFQGFIYIYNPSSGGSLSGKIKYRQIPGLSEDESKAYCYFTSMGLSEAATCGIMGNIYRECAFSSGYYFATDLPDAGGTSGGICMWHDDLPDCRNFSNFKRDCPNWRQSIDYQLEYLYQSLILDGNGGESTKYYYGCNGCIGHLKSVPNTRQGAMDAAAYFRDDYERPAPDYEIREQYAASYWDKTRGR